MEMPDILVIDDDPAMLDCIRMSLITMNTYQVRACSDAFQALEWLKTESFSAVISDVNMPRMNGLELLKWVGEFDSKIPVILITGNDDSEIMLQAIHLGAYEFLKKPFLMSDLHITVKQAVQKHELLVQNDIYRNHLENLVEQRTKELNDARSMLEKSYLNTIRAMVNAMEVNDIYTRGHSDRVTAISVMLGQALELDSEDLQNLRIGALLHDLGKIGILSNVLKKEQRLTDTEYDSMKQHPIIGAKIIDPIGLPDCVREIILQHHEWYDGNGYPYGIDHHQINPLASIVSVADSVDAMTSQRPYRDNLDFPSAVKEVWLNQGKQFDPKIAKTLSQCQLQINLVMSNPNKMKELLIQDLR